MITMDQDIVAMETVPKPDQISWMEDLEGMIETHAYGEGK